MSRITPSRRYGAGMAYVKLDCDMITSSIWWEKPQRDLFITALLMAEPRELREPMRTVRVDSTEFDDWTVPAGWYGFVRAAGVGIMKFAGVSREDGMPALQALASPDPSSKSQAFEGRRMVRVDGGFVILNFI